MKVNKPNSISVEDKIRAKFGDKFKKAKVQNKKNKDTKEISKKATKKANRKNVSVGDIKENSPDSEVTKEKLKALLKTGGFHFNDQERSALSDILDV